MEFSNEELNELLFVDDEGRLNLDAIAFVMADAARNDPLLYALLNATDQTPTRPPAQMPTT